MKTLVHPWPVHGKGTRIVPVFLPFAGCRTRCIYCAQTLQTGRSLQGIRQVLDEAFSMLRARSKRGLEPCELAFYGGTFTALERSAFGFCLHSALEWRNMGLISSWRCSTRPDCLDERLLLDMRAAGCTTVELGIQSFVNEVLRTSLRGYDAETALKAMEMVKNAGLKLGVQLLPGLPGHTASDFVDDVNRALAAKPAFMRFYPCLVVEGTGLAKLYREGRYVPWSVETTISALSEGILLSHEKNVPVIRLGVAVEQGFEEHVLAGPRDPNLGTRVLSGALLKLVERDVERHGDLRRMELPRAVQGYLYGHRRENAEALGRLGLKRESIGWISGEEIRIFCG